MSKYQKRPVIIEAIQWTGSNIDEVEIFVDGTDKGFVVRSNLELKLLFFNGYMTAMPGDYIIKTSKGEVYPCIEANFNEIYLEIEE